MGRGGMRWGAGRPATHVKAERCLRIDARRWAREGLFAYGQLGLWVWRDADTLEETSRIGYRGESGAITLDFTVNGEPVKQFIRELRTPCNFGGSRSWFACPRCTRRVAVMFLRGSAGFMCRHCGRVVYASQSDDDIGRTWRKQHKAEAKLGKAWSRPKGMHKATRARLMDVILDCEWRRDEAVCLFMEKHFPGRL